MGKTIRVDIPCRADMVTSQAWMMQPKVVERSYVLACFGKDGVLPWT